MHIRVITYYYKVVVGLGVHLCTLLEVWVLGVGKSTLDAQTSLYSEDRGIQVPMPPWITKLSHLTSDRQVGWGWRLTSDVSLSSGLTSDHFFFEKNPFFEKKLHFFEKKWKNPFFFLWKQGHSETEEVQCSPTVHHWWDTQTKQTRQTYRQSIETTRRQFTNIWSLFITMENKYCVHTSWYMSLESCMWGT
jgi:hypothetical protein